MEPVDMDSLVDLLETDRLTFCHWLSRKMAYADTRLVVDWHNRRWCCILKALVDVLEHDSEAAQDSAWLFMVLATFLPHVANLRCRYRDHLNSLLLYCSNSFHLAHLVMSHCSDVNFQATDGSTLAWRTSYSFVLNLLVQRGADLNLFRGKDDRGACGDMLRTDSNDYGLQALRLHVRTGVLNLYPCAALSSANGDKAKARARLLVRAHEDYCADLLALLGEDCNFPSALCWLALEYAVPVAPKE